MSRKYNKDKLQLPEANEQIERDNKSSNANLTINQSINDLFRINVKTEEIVMIPTDQIRDYGGTYGKHRFKLRQSKIEEIADSIRLFGILTPLILRNDKTGVAKYECISGHTRKTAAALANISEVPAIVRDYTNEEAELVMAVTNHQREELYPSEKAWLYRIEYDTMKRRAGRKVNGDQIGNQKKSIDLLAERSEDTRNQILRYIRLSYLNDPLLDRTDQKQIPVNAAVEISYLVEREQELLEECIAGTQAKLDCNTAKELRLLSKKAAEEEHMLRKEEIKRILTQAAGEKVKNFTILLPSQIKEYIPEYLKDKKAASQYFEITMKLAYEDKLIQQKIKETLKLYKTAP